MTIVVTDEWIHQIQVNNIKANNANDGYANCCPLLDHTCLQSILWNGITAILIFHTFTTISNKGIIILTQVGRVITTSISLVEESPHSAEHGAG